MAIGALKSLFTILKNSAFLAGVSVAFGEELVYDQTYSLPYVVLVPKGGTWDGPGYARGLDAAVENIWTSYESIDIYMSAASSDPTAQQPIDHADAVETLRQQVLSALQDQRVQMNADGTSAIGLYWKPTTGRWEMAQGGIERFGRTYVLTCSAEISVPMNAPIEATIKNVTTNQSISGGQHVA